MWTSRTHAIAESIVELFYPKLLASRELADATQAWLDAHADAPAGLRRLVAENRDGITRALRGPGAGRRARLTRPTHAQDPRSRPAAGVLCRPGRRRARP